MEARSYCTPIGLANPIQAVVGRQQPPVNDRYGGGMFTAALWAASGRADAQASDGSRTSGSEPRSQFCPIFRRPQARKLRQRRIIGRAERARRSIGSNHVARRVRCGAPAGDAARARRAVGAPDRPRRLPRVRDRRLRDARRALRAARHRPHRRVRHGRRHPRHRRGDAPAVFRRRRRRLRRREERRADGRDSTSASASAAF